MIGTRFQELLEAFYWTMPADFYENLSKFNCREITLLLSVNIHILLHGKQLPQFRRTFIERVTTRSGKYISVPIYKRGFCFEIVELETIFVDHYISQKLAKRSL